MELDQKWETNWGDRPAEGGEANSGSPGRRGKIPQTWQTNKVGLSSDETEDVGCVAVGGYRFSTGDCLPTGHSFAAKIHRFRQVRYSFL